MIPVQNIYYLLSYAWNKLDESETLSAGVDDYDDLLNLLSRVLINGCGHLLKRGLHANYLLKEEAYRGIKGKFLIAESIKTNTLNQGMAICEFDEFSSNTLPNQLIKSTLRLLVRLPIDPELRKSCLDLAQRFPGVSWRSIQPVDFKRVRLQRNNYHYRFVLQICELIQQNIVLHESKDEYQFRDFVRDHHRMADLFEAFLLNFYRKHSGFPSVRREDIHWAATPLKGTTVGLPKMQTDISLESENRKIIIDAKFYNQALQKHYDRESIRSANLYQLYAYLKNIKHSDKHPMNHSCEGILLYPTVKKELTESYLIDEHQVTIATVNLNQDWRGVERELIEVVNKTAAKCLPQSKTNQLNTLPEI
jgi:5-methylcytosine-specific restriction enzyme subunit McrC